MGGILLYRLGGVWVDEYIWGKCYGRPSINIRFELSFWKAVWVDVSQFCYGFGYTVYG